MENDVVRSSVGVGETVPTKWLSPDTEDVTSSRPLVVSVGNSEGLLGPNRDVSKLALGSVQLVSTERLPPDTTRVELVDEGISGLGRDV